MGSTLQLRKLADTSGARNEDGSWPLKSVVLEGEAPRNHQFSTTFVTDAITDGWATLDGNRFTLKLGNGNVVYRITGYPGRYEDADEPSGFRQDNFYTVELEGGL